MKTHSIWNPTIKEIVITAALLFLAAVFFGAHILHGKELWSKEDFVLEVSKQVDKLEQGPCLEKRTEAAEEETNVAYYLTRARKQIDVLSEKSVLQWQAHKPIVEIAVQELQEACLN